MGWISSSWHGRSSGSEAEGRLLDSTPCEDCGRRAAWLCKYRVDHDGNTCERAVCAEHSRVRGWPGRELWSCLVHDSPEEQLAMELPRVFDYEDPATWGGRGRAYGRRDRATAHTRQCAP